MTVRGVVAIAVVCAACSEAPADDRDPPRPPTPTPVPMPTHPVECGTLQIRIDAGGELMMRAALVPTTVPHRGTEVDKTALDAALSKLAHECIGPVAIAAPADLEYRTILDVMDTAKGAGFTTFRVDGGGAALQMDVTR